MAEEPTMKILVARRVLPAQVPEKECIQVRVRDGDNCRVCGVQVSWESRKGPHGATYLVLDGCTSVLQHYAVVACRSCASGARSEGSVDLRMSPADPHYGSNTQAWLESTSRIDTAKECGYKPGTSSMVNGYQVRRSPADGVTVWFEDRESGTRVGLTARVGGTHEDPPLQVLFDADASDREFSRQAPSSLAMLLHAVESVVSAADGIRFEGEIRSAE